MKTNKTLFHPISLFLRCGSRTEEETNNKAGDLICNSRRHISAHFISLHRLAHRQWHLPQAIKRLRWVLLTQRMDGSNLRRRIILKMRSRISRSIP